MKIKLFMALALSFALLLSGCGKAPAPDDLFAPVLEDYRELVKNDFYISLIEDSDAYNESTGEYIGNEFRLYRDPLYYAFHDVDENGTPELVIAGSFASDVEAAPLFFNIYSHDGKKPVRLFDEYEFGERINFTLLADAVIRIDYSNSAFESGVDLYCLRDGRPELADAYIARTENHDDGSAEFFFTKNGENITEEEYIEATKPIDPIKLDWQIIE